MPASSARSRASRCPTRTPSCSSCRGRTRPSSTSWRSTSPTPCPRRRSRSTAPISASTRSAPAPSSSPSGRSGQRLVLERNADYWKPGVPKLDRIVFEVGQEPLVALLRLQRGEVDILGDRIPPAKFLEVKNSPEWGDNDHRRRPAPHRLRDDERQRAALRQEGGPPGGQPRDQQGPHRPHHQRPRGAGEPAAAALDAGLRQGLPGLRLRSGQGQGAAAGGRRRRRLRDRALRHQHRSQPAHRPGDPAGSGGGRHQGRAAHAGAGQRDRRRRREGRARR